MSITQPHNPAHESTLSRLGLFQLEPLVLQPARLVEVLCTMQLQDWPTSLVELGRLGVPRWVQALLLDLASDQITEAELVRAFVLHLTGLRSDQVRNAWRVWLTRNRLQSRLAQYPLSVEESLALMTLNNMAQQSLLSWQDWAGPWALAFNQANVARSGGME